MRLTKIPCMLFIWGSGFSSETVGFLNGSICHDLFGCGIFFVDLWAFLMEDEQVDNPKPERKWKKFRDLYRYQLSEVDHEFIMEQLAKHKPITFIADRIGCSQKALREYIHKTPLLQEAYTNHKDAMDDLCEVRLFEKINQGDLGAIMFYMPRQMRHRGYGDHQVIESREEQPRVIIGRIDVSPEEKAQEAQEAPQDASTANAPPLQDHEQEDAPNASKTLTEAEIQPLTESETTGENVAAFTDEEHEEMGDW